MKLLLLVAVAGAVAPPRIELDLDSIQNTLGDYASVAKLERLKKGSDDEGVHNLGYKDHRLRRQDWTQRCPAGAATTAINCPVPTAQAFDHTDGALPVTTTIHLVDLNNTRIAPDLSQRTHIDYTKRSTWLVFFDAQDAAGNEAEQVVFAIILDDTAAPTITQCTDQALTYVEANTTQASNLCWNDQSYDAYDKDTTWAIRYQVANNEDLDTFLTCDGEVDGETLCTAAEAQTLITGLETGVFTVYINARDTAGMYGHRFLNNKAEDTREIVVRDTTNPTISRTGMAKIQHQCATSYTDDGATCWDSFEGAINDHVSDDSAERVDAYNNGHYTVTYKCHDNATNPRNPDGSTDWNWAQQVTRIVEVHDKVPPTIELRSSTVGDVTMKETITHHSSKGNKFTGIGEGLTDPGVTCEDACDTLCKTGNCAMTTSWDKTFDERTEGDYVRTYTCTDHSGNSKSVNRTFTVVDSDAPVIYLVGDETITVEADLNRVYADDGATCEDWHHSPLTPELTINSDDVNLAVTGTYSVTYRCVDPKDIEVTKTRTVVVKDTTAPVLTLTGDSPVYVEAGFEYVDERATAWDNIDLNVTDTVAKVGDTVNVRKAFYARRSCAEIKKYYADAESGDYFITVYVASHFQRIPVFCDMTSSVSGVSGFTYAKVDAAEIEATPKGDNNGDCVTMDMTMAKYHGQASLEQYVKDYYCQDALAPCPWFEDGDSASNYYVCELLTREEFASTDHMTHDIPHDQISHAEQGKYIIKYTAHDRSNVQAAPIFRTVVVKDTLPPVIQLKWAENVVSQSDSSQRGIGDVENTPFAADVNSGSFGVADDRHRAPENEGDEDYAPRSDDNTLPTTAAPETLMAEEVTAQSSAWVLGGAAAAVAGLALLGFSQRKQAATVSVPV